MDETTNQSVDSMETTSDDLSFDEMVEDTPETVEETKPAETEPEPFLDIRYNGADEHLTREQAIEYAQKGRNYDKVYNQLQELRNDPTRLIFEEQAKNAGLTLQEYANRMAQFQQASAINRIAKEFMTKNPDATEQIAQQYAQAEYRNQLAQKQQEQAQQKQNEQTNRQNRAAEQVTAFRAEYPDVNLKELPQEVIEDIDKNGESLLSAYRHYENKQLREQLQAARKNGVNRSKSVGAITENAGKSGEGDPFLAGLLGQ